MDKKKYKYITVEKHDTEDHVYVVTNNRSGEKLGYILPDPLLPDLQWGEVVFSPDQSRVTIWSKSCLDDIQDAIDWITEEEG